MNAERGACDHTTPDYFGRCGLCHERLESPSRWMLDQAKRTGGSIVSITKTYRVRPDGSLEPASPEKASVSAPEKGLGGAAT